MRSSVALDICFSTTFLPACCRYEQRLCLRNRSSFFSLFEQQKQLIESRSGETNKRETQTIKRNRYSKFATKDARNKCTWWATSRFIALVSGRMDAASLSIAERGSQRMEWSPSFATTTVSLLSNSR